MKRILVLALALIVAISSLAVPSYAAESGSQIIDNWLESVEYNVNGKVVASPAGWISNSTVSTFEFDVACNVKADQAFLNFNSPVKPSSVVFSDGVNNFYASSITGSGDSWQAVWDVIDYPPNGIRKVIVNYSSAVSGWVVLNSFYGVAVNTLSYSNVSYFVNAILYDNGDGGTDVPVETDFRWPLSVDVGNNVSLPVVVDFTGPTGGDFYSLDYGEVFLKVPLDQGFQFLDSMSFLVYVCDDLTSCGARLENASGTVYDGLSCEVEYCGETQMIFELEENFYRLKCYVVTVDLTGYDLSGLTLTVQSNVSRAFGSWIYQYDYGFYFQCASIYGSYSVDELPWYSVFAIWLKKQFGVQNDLISSLYQLTSDFRTIVITWFENINGTLNNFKGAVITWFETLNGNMTYYLSQILNALNSSGDSQDFQDDVGQQGDKLDDMAGIMDSVTQPALDSIDTDLSGIVSDADLTNVANVYTSVIGDGFMSQIMLMVSVMAMMSFALFGKR